MSPEALAELIGLIDAGTISGKIAKDVFEKMWATRRGPEAIVEREGLVQVSDEGAIQAAIDEVLAASPEQVATYRKGKTSTLGWFVGQVMKKTGGKANPAVVNALLKKALDASVSFAASGTFGSRSARTSFGDASRRERPVDRCLTKECSRTMKRAILTHVAAAPRPRLGIGLRPAPEPRGTASATIERQEGHDRLRPAGPEGPQLDELTQAASRRPDLAGRREPGHHPHHRDRPRGRREDVPAGKYSRLRPRCPRPATGRWSLTPTSACPCEDLGQGPGQHEERALAPPRGLSTNIGAKEVVRAPMKSGRRSRRPPTLFTIDLDAGQGTAQP